MNAQGKSLEELRFEYERRKRCEERRRNTEGAKRKVEGIKASRAKEENDAPTDSGEAATVIIPTGYRPLFETLMEAFRQASEGKGKERHGNGRPFLEQPIFTIAESHGAGFLTGQAVKKLCETPGLYENKGADAAVRELLGAIVYSAAAVIYLQSGDDDA